jgi:hypothetical protein
MRRRNFFGLLGGIAAFPAATAAQQVEAGKLSKAQAQYQDNPKGIAMCATCTLFVAPRSCKLVEGNISPSGWCKAYAMAD